MPFGGCRRFPPPRRRLETEAPPHVRRLGRERRLGDRRTLVYTLDARCISMVDPGSMETFREIALEIVSVAEELGEIELGAPAIFSRFDENYAFKGTVG